MRWEYRIEGVPGNLKRRQELFDVLGEHGWELVSVDNMVAFFKRVQPSQHQGALT